MYILDRRLTKYAKSCYKSIRKRNTIDKRARVRNRQCAEEEIRVAEKAWKAEQPQQQLEQHTLTQNETYSPYCNRQRLTRSLELNVWKDTEKKGFIVGTKICSNVSEEYFGNLSQTSNIFALWPRNYTSRNWSYRKLPSREKRRMPKCVYLASFVTAQKWEQSVRGREVW